MAIDHTSFLEKSDNSAVFRHWMDISKKLFVIPGMESYFTGNISSVHKLQSGHVLLCDGTDRTLRVTSEMVKVFLEYIMSQNSTSWIGAPVDMGVTVS